MRGGERGGTEWWWEGAQTGTGGGGMTQIGGCQHCLRGTRRLPPAWHRGPPRSPPPPPCSPPPAYRHSGSCVLSLMEQVPPFRQ